MPETGTDRGRRATRPRRPIHPLPRQREHKPVAKPTMAARERILNQLSDLITACEELFEEHGVECCCEGYCLVSNVVGSLRVFRMILEIT